MIIKTAKLMKFDGGAGWLSHKRSYVLSDPNRSVECVQ